MQIRHVPHTLLAVCAVAALALPWAARAQSATQNETIAEPAPHNSGILLATTDLYDVTTSALSADWCVDLGGRSQAQINIIWRVGADVDLGGFSAAYHRHLSSVWNEVEKHCARLESAYVSNYVAGVRLSRSGSDEVAENVALPQRVETPLNILLISRDASGRFVVELTRAAPGYSTLTSARKFRGTKVLVSLPPGRSMGPANETGSNVGLGARSTTPAWILPGRSAPSSRTPGASSLRTGGAAFADLYQNIYLGRFEELRADRRLSGDLFEYIFPYTASAYGEICVNDIAADSPTIVVTRTTTNGFGAGVDERKARYRIDTRFAEKAEQYRVPFLRDSVGRELEALVQANGCVDAPMIQFLENLLRYAYGKPPIQQVKPGPIARYPRTRDVRSSTSKPDAPEEIMLQIAVNTDMDHRYLDRGYHSQQRQADERAVYDREVPLNLEVSRMLVMSCSYSREGGRHSYPYLFWKDPKPGFVTDAWRKGLSLTNPYRHIGDPRAQCPPQEPAAPYRPHPADVLAHLPLPDKIYEPEPAVATQPESAPARGAAPRTDARQAARPRTVPSTPGQTTAIPEPAPASSTPRGASPERPASDVSTAFAVGDSIEVKWSGTWYAATILERRGDSFKIHYSGYASSWDEWVTTARMRRR